MIAIETRYVGATNTRPSRIIATTANGQRHIISYESALSAADENGAHESEAAHRAAATQLAEAAGWLRPGLRLVSGATKRGMVFVFDAAV